jgi:hypothetical protein
MARSLGFIVSGWESIFEYIVSLLIKHLHTIKIISSRSTQINMPVILALGSRGRTIVSRERKKNKEIKCTDQ